MSLFPRAARFAAALLTLAALTACSHPGAALQRERVKIDFESFRQALLHRQTNQAIGYVSPDFGRYLLSLKDDSNAGSASIPAPAVDHLLRAFLHDKMSPDLRAHLNLQLLVQRLGDRGLLDCREIRDVSLGQVTVTGDRAQGELYFQGNLLPLRVPFALQDGVWKVDLLSLLPYAELLMRLDRAVTGKSESQQVAQIVAPLPVL